MEQHNSNNKSFKLIALLSIPEQINIDVFKSEFKDEDAKARIFKKALEIVYDEIFSHLDIKIKNITELIDWVEKNKENLSD